MTSFLCLTLTNGNGPTVIHPVTGAQIRAVDLIGEWVKGPDGSEGTDDDALDN
jgi:hypothetical protein